MQVKGHGQKYTRRHETALAALLSEPTLEAAAKKVGVSISTLSRWMTIPEFAEKHRAARRDSVSAATTALQRHAAGAVATLAAVMDNPEAPPAVRVSAARSVLDLAYRAAELDDVLARLAALEQSQDTEGR